MVRRDARLVNGEHFSIIIQGGNSKCIRQFLFKASVLTFTPNEAPLQSFTRCGFRTTAMGLLRHLLWWVLPFSHHPSSSLQTQDCPEEVSSVRITKAINYFVCCARCRGFLHIR